jgi:hypothetical protein
MAIKTPPLPARQITDALPTDPVARALTAAQWAGDAKRLLNDLRHEAIYEATRTQPYEDVAEALGVGYSFINKCITLHLKSVNE